MAEGSSRRFWTKDEIDEFRIHVIPILIGEGIPLIQPRHLSIPLKLLSSKAFPDGVVELNYRVRPFVETVQHSVQIGIQCSPGME